MKRRPVEGNDGRDRAVDLARRILLVLGYEVAQSRRLRNRVVEVLTQTCVAVIRDVLLNDRLIQPVGRWSHPSSERRVPLDDLLLTVTISPRLDLRTPPPRIRCELLHVVLGERIIDSPVD